MRPERFELPTFWFVARMAGRGPSPGLVCFSITSGRFARSIGVRYPRALSVSALRIVSASPLFGLSSSACCKCSFARPESFSFSYATPRWYSMA